METPLALLLYEVILPGSQVVIRLQDLGYRVHTLANPKELVEHAEREKPLVIIADLISQTTNVAAAIRQLKANPNTQHIPVITFLSHDDTVLRTSAQEAGAAIVASDTAILAHLPQLLDQALHVE